MKRCSWSPMLIVFAVLIAAGFMVAMNQTQQQGIEDRIQPRVEIIAFGDTVISGLGKFDTSTGEIKKFLGDPRDSGSSAAWAPAVDGVGHEAPGTFRLQNAEIARPGLFLVNVATGETWILAERREAQFQWRKMREFD